MDYKAFYEDIVDWINQANQAAARFGISSSEFWQWVAESSGKLCLRYQDNRLAVKQMTMMVEWLEEVSGSRRTT